MGLDAFVLQQAVEPEAVESRLLDGDDREGSSRPSGLQIGDGGLESLASLERTKSVAESHQRGKVQRRNRSRVRNQICRLIYAVTENPAKLPSARVQAAADRTRCARAR